MSTPRRSANRRSSASFSDSAGTDTATFGSETPLLFETSPPSTTRQWMSRSSTLITSTATLPSSISNRSPALTSSGQPAVGAAHPLGGSQNVVAGDDNRVSDLPHDGAIGELTQTDLRPLEVGESSNGATGAPRRFPYQLEDLFVILIRTVAEIQSGNIHAGLNKLPDALRGGVAGPSVQTIFARRLTSPRLIPFVERLWPARAKHPA